MRDAACLHTLCTRIFKQHCHSSSHACQTMSLISEWLWLNYEHLLPQGNCECQPAPLSICSVFNVNFSDPTRHCTEPDPFCKAQNHRK